MLYVSVVSVVRVSVLCVSVVSVVSEVSGVSGVSVVRVVREVRVGRGVRVVSVVGVCREASAACVVGAGVGMGEGCRILYAAVDYGVSGMSVKTQFEKGGACGSRLE
mgnify:CR=1 FL=1